jgi:hypothetical protein
MLYKIIEAALTILCNALYRHAVIFMFAIEIHPLKLVSCLILNKPM